MNKRERFKLFELSCLDGNSGYNHLDKSLNEFLSDNFESGVPRKDDYYKFPIRQIRKNSPKKKQNNEKNKKNDKKFRKRKAYWFNDYPNNPKLDLLTLSKKFNKKRTKKFPILNKNEDIKKNNLNNEFNNNNLDILSLDSVRDFHPKYPKNRTRNNNPIFFLHQDNVKTPRVRSSYIFGKQKQQDINNIQSFSLTNFLNAQFENMHKKSSDPQSPSSTMVKTRLKNVSFKSDNDNITDSISLEKTRKKMKKVRSVLSLRSNDDSNLDLNDKSNITILDDDLGNQSHYSSFEERKKLRQKIKLKNLVYQIEKAEKNQTFKPDEYRIRPGFNFLNKFKRVQFAQRIKSAKQKNLFFFNYPFQINKFIRLSKKNKTNQIPHQNMCNKKSIKLLKNLQKLQTNLKNKKREIKSNERNNIELDKLKYFINKLKAKKDFNKKIDEQFKQETVNYQGQIGKFFIYKGNGIFSGHLNMMLRGDKIAHNLIKLENL